MTNALTHPARAANPAIYNHPHRSRTPTTYRESGENVAARLDRVDSGLKGMSGWSAPQAGPAEY